MDEPEVTPGRLVELPTAGATGMERWCHGEFVSGRGEMCSYAFGWRTDEPRHGKWSIGFGVGNPGGATISAELLIRDGELGYGLVDEAFVDVPQGGPHLTAEEARAHDTLPFVWFVVDTAFARDPRARWLEHWIRGTRAITTAEVLAASEPVLLVANDDDDDLWQLIGTTDAADSTGSISHLSHFVDEDPSLVEVLDLAPGEQATRERVGGPWRR